MWERRSGKRGDEKKRGGPELHVISMRIEIEMVM